MLSTFVDNYIFITADGHPLPIAYRLAQEGKHVTVGMVEHPVSKESPSTDKQRHELYEGMLSIGDADDLLEGMRSIENKDEYFVMFDYGDLWPWSERALDMGFTKGIFPTEKGYELEQDRKAGKKFAKENFPEIYVADAVEFSDVNEALEFLADNPDKLYVLKSCGSEAETVVPMTTNPELARRQIEGALHAEKSEYEKGSFTLEEKIKNPIEISPVMVFWNGKPLFSLVEIENKGLGAGNIGRLTGGCQNLTVLTNLDCGLNRIAFPKAIHDLAARQVGVGIYDAGLLFDGERFNFTEFCSQRWGWDGIFSELTMCRTAPGDKFVSRHFDTICDSRSPIQMKYGCAVRLFQTQPDSKEPEIYKHGYTIDWPPECEENLFFYCIKNKILEESTRFFNVGYKKDLGVAVGASDYLISAVDEAYWAARSVAMTGVYYRPKFDFLSEDYSTSILKRFRCLANSGLI